MKIIDLTHTIQPDMPVYPGTEQPTFADANSLDGHGFIEKKITLYSHTGTHMDGPAHILESGKTLDSFPVDHFMGRAYMISLESYQKTHEQREIDKTYILDYEDQLKDVDYVIFNTGWGKHWGSEEFYSAYPILSEESAIWLTEKYNLKGIGTDSISIDHEDSTYFPIHKIFFRKGLVVIENLANLDMLKKQPKFQLFCLPLKTKDADGAPIRAIAVAE
ncbi:MAG: hydrolase [Gracilibacter sp. BRH_c7a]|nr:MAG: hydrolase [Gracilibacter sp. BRH_c7a]